MPFDFRTFCEGVVFCWAGLRLTHLYLDKVLNRLTPPESGDYSEDEDMNMSPQTPPPSPSSSHGKED